MWSGDEAPLAQSLREIVGQRHGATVSYATDGGWLQTAWHRCVIFGPGTIDVAHKPNERIPIEEFHRAGDILEELVQQRCIDR